MVPPPTRGAPSTSRTVAVWLALGLMLLNALQPTPLHAEHPAGLLSERVHNRLVTVQADITAGDLDRALTRARALLGSLADKPYDHAMVLQALGHIHIARAEWSAALEVLEQALRLAVLEPARAQDIRNKLVRLNIASGAYARGIALFEAWVDAGGKPQNDDLLSVAHANLKLERHAAAARILERLVAASRQPPTSWYRALLSAWHALGRLERCIGLVHRLIAREPERRQHWMMLASLHEERRDSRAATAVLALGYRQAVLTRPEDVLRLSGRYLAQGAPYKAARLLEGALDRDHIEVNRAHLLALSDAWLQAREWSRARTTLQRIEGAGRSAELQWRAARIAVTQRDWRAASVHLEQALAAGLVGAEAGSAWLLLGMARSALRQDDARAAFLAATDFPQSAAEANRWLDYLDAVTDRRRRDSG